MNNYILYYLNHNNLHTDLKVLMFLDNILKNNDTIKTKLKDIVPISCKISSSILLLVPCNIDIKYIKDNIIDKILPFNGKFVEEINEISYNIGYFHIYDGCKNNEIANWLYNSL